MADEIKINLGNTESLSKPVPQATGTPNVNGASAPPVAAAPAPSVATSGAAPSAAPPEAKPYVISGVSGSQESAQPKLSFLQSLLKKANGSNAQAPASGNAFTKLFGASSPVPTPQSKAATPALSAFLGPKPVFSKSDYDEKERDRRKLGRRLVTFAIIAGAAVYGFFYTQLHPDFTLLNEYTGVNVARRFTDSNTELKNIQTKMSLSNFRMARLWLDEVNGQIDPLETQMAIRASSSTTKAEKELAKIKFETLAAQAKKSLAAVQKILNQPLGVETYETVPVEPAQREAAFKNLLKEEIANAKNALGGTAKANQDELRMFDSILRLVENESFRRNLASKDFEAITDDALMKLLDEIRAQGLDELSMIHNLRIQRPNWRAVIDDVHNVARMTDSYYGEGQFKTYGGFLFSSYVFDSKTQRIKIIGVTKQPNPKTFSYITKLIESIEKSPKFKDIDFRSFTKTREESGDYSSTLNLDFAIQGSDEKDPRDDIPITPAS